MEVKIYEVTKNSDGQFELNQEQRKELSDFPNNVTRALRVLNSYNAKPIDNGDACSTCGDTKFLRTGTCHVCVGCGTSQGCS